jgi:hypothetical protein
MNRTAHAPMLISALCFFTSLVGCADLSSSPISHHAAPRTVKLALDHSIAGYWEDVAFSKADVNTVLAYANQATLNQLDVDAKLDLRAAHSIIAAQPIATMGELSQLHFVGASTLTRLKAAALQDDAGRSVVCVEPHARRLVAG